MEELKIYTVNEVAEKLSITVRTLYNYIKNGDLKAVKIGKYWRITEDNLRAFLENGTKKAEADGWEDPDVEEISEDELPAEVVEELKAQRNAH